MTHKCSPESAVRNIAAGLVPAAAIDYGDALRVTAVLAAIILTLLNLTMTTEVCTLILLLLSHDAPPFIQLAKALKKRSAATRRLSNRWWNDACPTDAAQTKRTRTSPRPSRAVEAGCETKETKRQSWQRQVRR